MADDRSPKDAIATMGMVLPDDVFGRDAVHVAVISAVASEVLRPGWHVSAKVGDDPRDVVARRSGILRGIVDPFLEYPVPVGGRFWLFLYPRTITGLKHVWTHPAFAESEPEVPEAAVHYSRARVRASKDWLRDFCLRSDCPDYATLMDAAARVADGEVVGWDEEYLHFDGDDAHGEIPDEFWDHVEVVLGRRIKGKRAGYFSCAC